MQNTYNEEIQELDSKLKIALRLENSQELKQNVFIMLDESTAVTESNFELQKQCVENLIKLFKFDHDLATSQTLLGFGKFSEKLSVVQELTNDSVALQQQLRGVSFGKGVTDMKASLQQAIEILTHHQRENANNLIVLFTHGNLGSSQQEFLNLSKMKDTRIVVIFLLKKPKANIYKNYSLIERQVIYFRNYQLTKDVFEKIVDSPAPNPPSFQDLKVGPDLVELYLKPQQSKTTDYEVEVADSNYNMLFQGHFSSQWPSIQITNLPLNKELLLRYKGYIDQRLSTKWSNEIIDPINNQNGWKKFYIEDNIKEIRTKFNLPIEQLTDINKKMKEDLKELIIPSHLAEFGVKNLKILFMGLCGTGKSSTIDTMCSIFKGEYTCIQPIGNSEHTLTTQLKNIEITGSQALNCIDSWGVEFYQPENRTLQGSNYGKTLKPILTGQIQPGFKLEHAENPTLSEAFKRNEQDITMNHKVHAVLVVVDMLNCQDAKQCEPITELLQQLTEHGIQPVIVLTKADLALQEINRDIKIENPPIKDVMLNYFNKLQTKIDQFYENIKRKVSKKNIKVFCNYTGDYSNPDQYREFLGLDILNTLKRRAIDYFESMFNNYCRIEIKNYNNRKNYYVDRMSLTDELQKLSQIRPAVHEIIERKRIFRTFNDVGWCYLKQNDLQKGEEEERVDKDNDERDTSINSVLIRDGRRKTLRIELNALRKVSFHNYGSEDAEEEEEQEEEEYATKNQKIKVIIYDADGDPACAPFYIKIPLSASLNQLRKQAAKVFKKLEKTKSSIYFFQSNPKDPNSVQHKETIKLKDFLTRGKTTVIIREKAKNNVDVNNDDDDDDSAGDSTIEEELQVPEQKNVEEEEENINAQQPQVLQLQENLSTVFIKRAKKEEFSKLNLNLSLREIRRELCLKPIDTFMFPQGGKVFCKITSNTESNMKLKEIVYEEQGGIFNQNPGKKCIRID